MHHRARSTSPCSSKAEVTYALTSTNASAPATPFAVSVVNHRRAAWSKIRDTLLINEGPAEASSRGVEDQSKR